MYRFAQEQIEKWIAAQRRKPLIVRGGRIVPIKVKSGAGGSLRSLHLMLDSYPNCPEGVVLYSGIYTQRPEQRLTFMPLYYAGYLGPPRPDIV